MRERLSPSFEGVVAHAGPLDSGCARSRGPHLHSARAALIAIILLVVAAASSLTLAKPAWTFSEPGPYNSPGNLRRQTSRLLQVDLTSQSLPRPRLMPWGTAPNVIDVPAHTDCKLHDITDASDATAKEPLDLNQPLGSRAFLSGNRRFITPRLWSVGNQAPYFHDGRYTTLREAVLGHAGEALSQRQAFERLAASEQALTEGGRTQGVFRKSLSGRHGSSMSVSNPRMAAPLIRPIVTAVLL